MAKNKRLEALSTINRAIGIIEGLAYGAEEKVQHGLFDALEMLEAALKEVLE